MTDRQQSILNYLRSRQAKGLPPPTIREIGDVCDISSTSVVAYNLEALVKKGCIIRHRETARGVILTGKAGDDSKQPQLPDPSLWIEAEQLALENARLTRRLEVANMRVKALQKQLEAIQAAR